MGQVQLQNQELDLIWLEAGCWVVSDVSALQRAFGDWAVQYAESVEVAMVQRWSDVAYDVYSRFPLLDEKAKD